jgi:hypothetical protein
LRKGATIVDDYSDQLARALLRQYRLQSFRKEPWLLEGRDDDANIDIPSREGSLARQMVQFSVHVK